VISGNENYGLGLVYGSRYNHVYGNFIGLNRTGTDTIGNGNYGGLRISDRSDSNLVMNNVISGNRVGITLFNACGNTMLENTIGGPPPSSTAPWSGGGNRFGGVAISSYESDVTEHNQLEDNVISGNGRMGVRVVGTGSRYNMIYRNRIFANEEGAINLEDGANEGILSPVIEDFNGVSVSGTAAPNAFVQLFTDDGRQAARYLNYTGTDGQGRFMMYLSGQALLANFTALVTDAKGNSSYLSRPFAAVSGFVTSGTMPSGFRLDPVYPNPFNPSATVRFSIQKPCRIRLIVIDLLGRTMAILADGLMAAGDHAVQLDASSWPSGNYFIRMATDGSGWSETRRFCVMK
jgi:parallel beta-helix repeat protein